MKHNCAAVRRRCSGWAGVECYTAYHWMPTALQSLRPACQVWNCSIAPGVRGGPNGNAARRSGSTSHSSARRPHRAAAAWWTSRCSRTRSCSWYGLAAPGSRLRGAGCRAGWRALASRADYATSGWFLKPLAGGRRGDPPLNFQVLPLTEAVVDFARAGLGVGVLSEWVAEPHLKRGDVVARRLDSRPLAPAVAPRLAQEVQESGAAARPGAAAGVAARNGAAAGARAEQRAARLEEGRSSCLDLRRSPTPVVC